MRLRQRGRWRQRRWWSNAAATSLGLWLAGCAGTESGAPFQGDIGATLREAGGAPVATQTAVRAARRDGYDRVVFEFAGDSLPGYRIEYVEAPVRQCGSGAPVSLAGDALLSVRLSPARAHDDAGRATVETRSLAPALPVVRELRLTCDFEAELTWVLGLAAPNPYRVSESSGPARLVIDIRH